MSRKQRNPENAPKEEEPVRRNRRDWLTAGLYRFAEGGLTNLAVEQIAKDLGVTKGSYYYYFNNREDYVEQMLDLALEITTTDYIKIASKATSAQEQMRTLLQFVFREDAGRDFDFYVRQFARTNPVAARFVRRMDHDRLGFLTHLLIQCGLSKGEAENRSVMLYNYFIGWYVRNSGKSAKRKNREADLALLEMLAGVPLRTNR